MSNAKRILICGLNGAGKSTLGRALADACGYVFRDIEDYYFSKDDSENPYSTARPKAEVAALLLDDLRRYPNIILAAVRADYSSEISLLLTHAVHVAVPRDIRLLRVRERSLRRFGNRALPDGDLHEQEEQFFRMIAARPDSYVQDWLSQTGLSVMEADGMLPAEENVKKLLSWIEQ